jgi:hypothetical protein
MGPAKKLPKNSLDLPDHHKGLTQ